jgi:hypothetical protein
MFGQMAELTKAIGSIIKCTEEDYTLGKTEENIKANTNTIKNMGSVLTHGKMAENMLANGKIANVMAVAR